MNKEDQIFDLLERLYIEVQSSKKELREEIQGIEIRLEEKISGVETRLEDKISNLEIRLEDKMSSLETRLTEDIKVLNDNQMLIFNKIEKIELDVAAIREEMADVQHITASNYRDIVRLKSVR